MNIVWSLLCPLMGFILISGFQSKLKNVTAGVIASVMCALSFGIILVSALTLPAFNLNLVTWFEIGTISANWGILKDSLSSLMGLMVTGIGTLIHVYSIGYMKGDSRFSRFFAYLNLFIFFMLILVFSNSFVGMFVGWEGVGLCSYLLIGFWHQNIAYTQAAKKAFVMNRIGDLGFMFALVTLWFSLGTTDYAYVLSHLNVLPPMFITFITLGLFVGAIGKSAQFPLLTWLPDAMAGPTPVSALIHAATMVTAGVYMISRAHPLFALEINTLSLITTLGFITSVIGGCIALAQSDIKKILAYSTVSQLGFLFVSLGIGAPNAALFHMATHACFKALLFLSAGNVIHALSGEQNIFNMGNLRKALPFTHLVFLIGTLAIIGCPPLSGFFSKDEILLSAFTASPWLFAGLVLMSLVTAWYMLRLYFIVFWAPAKHEGHPHEGTGVMNIPLGILAILSIIASQFPIPAMPHIHHAPYEMQLLIGTLIGLSIIGFATYVRYAKSQLTETKTPVLSDKFYLDEIYAFFITSPYLKLCKLLAKWGEPAWNSPLSGLVWLTQSSGSKVLKLQSGKTSTYMLIFLIGIVILLGVTFLS
jgi:NADH-quinone oxidoreductase subunit L